MEKRITSEAIRKEFEVLAVLESASDRLDDLWEADPMNESIEAEADAAYKAMWHQMDKLAGMIAEYSGIKKKSIWGLMQEASTREVVKSIFRKAA